MKVSTIEIYATYLESKSYQIVLCCMSIIVLRPYHVYFDLQRHGPQEQGNRLTLSVSTASIRLHSDDYPGFLTLDCTGMWRNSWKRRFWNRGKEKKKRR